MIAIKHSVEEERVIKKAKVMYNGNEQVPVSDMEDKNGKVCSMAIEKGKGSCVELESHERKNEVSGLSLVENTNTDSIKEADVVVSGGANIEKLPVLEGGKKKKRKRKSKGKKQMVVEEGKEICVKLESNEREIEVSSLSLAENTNIDSIKEGDVFVSGDANIEKLPVLEGGKKKKRKRKSKALVSGRKQMVVEEGKEICVELESNERKVEVSGLSLAENTNVDSIKEADIVVSGDVHIEKLPVLEVEKKKKKKRKSKASVSGKKQMVVEEGKEKCVELESNEGKIEVSGLSLAENTNIDSIKEVDVVVSSDANIEKLPVLEGGKKKKKKKRKSKGKQMVVEEGKEKCAELEASERKNEVSGLSLAENTNIDSIKEADVVVSGDANIENLPVLEVEKKIEESRSNPSVSGKKLLVLDLNGLLADIVPRCGKYKADIYVGGKAIFKRPFCEEFLKFCFDKFEVGIWSSRMKRNVERISEFLLGDMKSKLLFCWDMSYCATTTIGSLENKNKFVVFKDLNRLWDKHDAELPWKKGVYNATNTVLLDDSPYKALLNPPYTAIFPQSYNHQNKKDASLGKCGDLRCYLKKLAKAENVQEFIKKNPFGQEGITEASESWEFYKQAMDGKSIYSHT